MNKYALIILAFNSEKFIVHTLKSILNSSFDGWDVIINDDFSSDSTANIVNEFINCNAEYTSKWIFRKGECNIGINASLKKCLELTPANWIKYLAADDELVSDALEIYKKNSIVSQDDNSLILSDMELIDENSNVMGRRNSLPKFAYTSSLLKGVHLYTNSINAPSVMISRRLLEVSLSSTSARNVEDWPVLRTAVLSNANLIIVNRPLVRYRQVSGSLSSHYRKKSFIGNTNKVRSDVIIILNENLNYADNFFIRYGIKIAILVSSSSRPSFIFFLSLLKFLNLQHLGFKFFEKIYFLTKN